MSMASSSVCRRKGGATWKSRCCPVPCASSAGCRPREATPLLAVADSRAHAAFFPAYLASSLALLHRTTGPFVNEERGNRSTRLGKKVFYSRRDHERSPRPAIGAPRPPSVEPIRGG